MIQDITYMVAKIPRAPHTVTGTGLTLYAAITAAAFKVTATSPKKVLGLCSSRSKEVMVRREEGVELSLRNARSRRVGSRSTLE